MFNSFFSSSSDSVKPGSAIVSPTYSSKSKVGSIELQGKQLLKMLVFLDRKPQLTDLNLYLVSNDDMLMMKHYVHLYTHFPLHIYYCHSVQYHL